MSTTQSLIVAFSCSLVGCILGMAAIKLDTLSKSQLRKLRETSKHLAEGLEQIFPSLLRFRLGAHILVTSLLFSSIFIFFEVARVQSNGYFWCLGLLLLLLPVLMLEVLVDYFSLTGTAYLLKGLLPVFRFFTWVFFPCIFPLERWIQHIQVRQEDNPLNLGKITAEDEILSLVEEEESPEDGTAGSTGLEQDEKRMLNAVITLDKTFVHEIMVPRVDMDVLPETAAIDEMKQFIVATGHSRIPIYHHNVDTISGVVYAKDLLDDTRIQNISSVLEIARKPVFIPETKNVSDLLDEFRQIHNHLAIVLDEYGGTAGMVTIEDILEEIVGEIQDEYDHEEANNPDKLHLEEDGSLICDARTTIWEVNDLLDLDISEELGFDTIGGYILDQLGKIPQKGEQFTTDCLEIHVLDADTRKVLKVQIRPLDNEKSTEE